MSTAMCPSGIRAQVSDVVFENFSMADGISNSTINCLYQDSKGFIWIGTPSGLNRYDGKTFKEYKNEPLNPQSLSSNCIHAICEDSKGYLWIATENGLNKLDRKTGQFDVFLNDEKTESSISNNLVFHVFVDSRDRIWVKTLHYLDLLNTTTGKFKHFEHYLDIFNPLPENASFPIFEDSYGILWVSTNDGLSYFDSKYEQFIRFENDPTNNLSISNNQVRCIFEDSKQQLWVGTSNGINKFDRKKKIFERFKLSGNSLTTINAIVEDHNFNLWVATSENGLIKFDANSKQTHCYTQNINSAKTVASNNVKCLLKDKSEIIWVGTRSGLSKLDSKKKKFNLYRNSAGSQLDISGNDVLCILADINEDIYVGTRNNGITKLNRLKKQVSFYTTSNKKCADNRIYSLVKLKDRNILAGSEAGVLWLNRGTNTFEAYPAIRSSKNYNLIANHHVKSLFQDTKQNIWIGTNRGLFRFSPRTSAITPYVHNASDASTISSNDISTIFESRSGDIWIGTDNGLNRFEPSAEMFERKVYEKNSNQGLSSNTIYSINQDESGTIWIGTAAGLNKYEPSKGGVFSYLTERDGLPNNQVFCIIRDGSDLWLSTNKGVARLSIPTGHVRSYNLSDGLQGFEFNPGAGCISPRGELFVGGSAGFNSFFPKSIHDNMVVPNIEVTNIIVYSNLGKQELITEGKKEITLPYDSRTFAIEFAALEFTQPNHNKYMYFMDGLENKWIDLDNRNVVSFSNIPPGEYTFIVHGSNSDEVWNEAGTSIKLIIETPFWKNKWAYLAYLLTMSLILYAYIELRTRTLRRANKVLREKELAAQEIAKQKEELAVKNKNIMDSITYAQRIQFAIMPSISKFKRLIPESFILYKPKDIVSGDFYWITEIGDKLFIAAVDCTGHGVPGAFMSIIGYDLLRNITKERGIHRPSEILDQLNKSLIELLTKNNVAVGEVKDGMDLTLCVFHKSKGVLEFSGALNPLYLIRNDKIIDIKGDRYSVGLGNEHPDENFKNHIIKLQLGDRLYIFSDGYADQFGGPSGKKMKFRRFRHLMLSIHNLPFEEQYKYLDEHFDLWRGQLEQVDDLLIIGMSFDYYLEQIPQEQSEANT